MRILRCNPDNSDYQNLIAELDADLKIRDGDVHWYYDQFNKSDDIHEVIVIYIDDEAVGCGAIKKYEEGVTEIKRMYTRVDKRGKGIASKILIELETWASEIGFRRCILETGIWQPEAISLYKKSEYRVIENYGQYYGRKESVCFGKNLKTV